MAQRVELEKERGNMLEARFKVRHNGQEGREWESISFVAIKVKGTKAAHEIAAGMAQVPGVYEVRMNWAGSQQGYYYKGGK